MAVLSSLFILFFPMIFMGRVLSPNDVFFSYEPWISANHVESQNSLMNDPATSYLTLVSMLRDDPGSFHWNRYIASGIPGFGSVASAVLSPFILLPALLLPLSLLYSGIVLLKIVVAFFFAYLWLREERLGKSASAIGATIFALSGIYSVWWLWQLTNATVLFPALMFFVARLAKGKRNSFPLMLLVALSFALAGFPAAVAAGGYVAVLYFVFSALRVRKLRPSGVMSAAAAGALALLIASPLLAPFVQFLRRSGYLESRAEALSSFRYPTEHLLSFIAPFRLGSPSLHDWTGDASLGVANNFIETTIYVGCVALLLALLGVFNRRASARFFWLALLALLVHLLFFASPLVAVLETLPGLRYSLLSRLRIILPLCFCYLGAAGAASVFRWSRRWRVGTFLAKPLPVLLVLVTATELALFAGRFYPFIEPHLTKVPDSETVSFLQAQPRPFRFVAMMDYLWPNASELYRLEDIRSHFGSEAAYREILERIDPESFGKRGTVLMLNSLSADLNDPFVSFLNVKYLLEHRSIDILRWKVNAATRQVGTIEGSITPDAGHTVRALLQSGDGVVHAVELVARIARPGANVRCVVALRQPETGKVISSRTFSSHELMTQEKLYLSTNGRADSFSALLLEVTFLGGSGELLRARPEGVGGAPIVFGLVRSGLILDRELSDGRIFENVAALPRWFAIWNVVRGTGRDYLRLRQDLGAVATTTEALPSSMGTLGQVPRHRRRALIDIQKYEGNEQQLRTISEVPFLLASSEKITPELRVSVDGREVNPMKINGMFAAVPVPAGSHQIVFSRRIGRGWWIVSLLALLAAFGATLVGNRRFRDRAFSRPE